MQTKIFADKTVVVLGKFSNYSREHLKSKLIMLGAHIEGNVTRKTDYVIVGDNPGMQADKAGKMGIKIRTEEEFEEMILQE